MLNVVGIKNNQFVMFAYSCRGSFIVSTLAQVVKYSNVTYTLDQIHLTAYKNFQKSSLVFPELRNMLNDCK